MTTDLANKTFVITGANTGIGKVTALELAKRGAHVILACRSAEKTQPVIDEIKRETGNDRIEFIALDLADLGSVRRCADELNKRNVPIHGLINNAGLAGQRGSTKDGFELAFGTNHLGHYLFTRRLLPRLEASGPARIVNVASDAHYGAKQIDWDALRKPTRSTTALKEYGVSKLANVLFTKELARKLDGKQVTAYAVHPGVVATDVWRRIPSPVRWIMRKFMWTPEQGAQSSLRCATDPELAGETGRYYGKDGHQKNPSRLAGDEQLAHDLWSKSAEWTGLSS
jgi:NAD(P)-dependent dehydrogenase (short-subunit alcohol dehydrogenase family)